MALIKLVMFIIAAPIGTVLVCRVLSALSNPTSRELEAAQVAKREKAQEDMTSAVQREALRQEERNELAA